MSSSSARGQFCLGIFQGWVELSVKLFCLKNFLVWKNFVSKTFSCLNNYLFWKILLSEKFSFLKIFLLWKIILSEQLSFLKNSPVRKTFLSEKFSFLENSPKIILSGKAFPFVVWELSNSQFQILLEKWSKVENVFSRYAFNVATLRISYIALCEFFLI